MRALRWTILFLLPIAPAATAQTPCNWTPQTGSVVVTCGSVGVGTTTPNGSGPFTISSNQAAGYGQLFLNSSATSGNIRTGFGLTSQSYLRWLVGNDLSLDGTNNFFIYDGMNNKTRLFISPTGNVGLGTIAPGGTLEISKPSTYNSEAAAGLVLTDGTPYTTKVDMGVDGTAAIGYIQTQAPTSYETRVLALQPNGGKLGVGTIAPAQKLDVEGAAVNGSSTTLLRVGTNDNAYFGSGGAIELSAMNNRGAADSVGRIAAFLTNGAVNQQSGDLVLSTSNNGAVNEHLRITAGGSVNVTGNIVATGSITGTTVIGATYQDLAEWVPTTTSLDPGTVVVLNRSRDNEVEASSEPYDTRVAGVVSANPGLILGVEAKGKEKIATTGRVKVRVDATRQGIGIGDLLVTSDVPGMAMKSQPIDVAGVKIHRPGTVIGKALQPLASGRGEILVLLSLQ